MGRTSEMTATPADVLKYQNDLVRTGKVLALGRIKQIAIGPAAGFTPPDNDPLIAMYGRMMQFRNRMLPIGQSVDRSMILVTAPLCGRDGRVGLEDWPMPGWIAPMPTKDEIEGIEKIDPTTGKTYRVPPEVDPSRYQAPLVPQNLRDRTNEKLQGSNFLVFSPVISIAFQPELDKMMQGTVWTIECGYNPADRTHATLLIDEATGETHFFGGLYVIQRPGGEG